MSETSVSRVPLVKVFYPKLDIEKDKPPNLPSPGKPISPLTKGVRLIIIIIYHRGVSYIMEREKKDVLLRLRRIEGQVRGLQRMVEEGSSCADILTQVAAVTAAIKKVGTVIVKTYMEECLDKSQKVPGVKRGDTFKDFQKAVSRYIDWA
jgi:DNA-binding FrmR family transcriptional regulator